MPWVATTGTVAGIHVASGSSWRSPQEALVVVAAVAVVTVLVVVVTVAPTVGVIVVMVLVDSSRC